MPVDELSLDELIDAVCASGGARPWSDAPVPGLVAVDLDAGTTPGPVPELHGGVRAVVVGRTAAEPPGGPQAPPAAALCDVVLAADDPACGAAFDAVAATVDAFPLASCALAVLLRGAAHRSVDAGLTAESAVYSTLQAGPEFAAWRAARPRRARPPEGDAVAVARDGPVLRVTLDRPHVRNALNTTMRDQLVEAFDLAALAPDVTAIHLRGAGPDFCAGGDLDEFGSFPDPATAHLVRLQQSVGRAIARVGDRVTAHLHGACVGSGIELPAFAATVVAAPSARISLPEVSLGLVPGAGGTVSIPRRIGRHRTARLALTGEVLDAPTALLWGLVDALDETRGDA
ncbi:MAG TPA: enoyl-CoA hydratase/isomerase family protein [Acidimicrobiales bacterium]|nr:enoyl-CoA hydratase/isomerase family protein [Acidimicrobiales bacterium]